MEEKKLLRILLVEDSDNDAQLLLREIRRVGYQIEHTRVETAQALKSSLAERQWDVVLCDYSLPHLDAPHALEIVKSTGLDLPFIIISGTIGEDSAVTALKAGAHDFIIKGKYARLGPALEREMREALVRRERSRAEEALREKERLLSEAQRIGQIGSWSLDIPSDTMQFTDEMYHLLDISPAEFQHNTRGFLNVIYAEDRSRAAKWMEEVKTGRHTKELDFRIFRTTSELRYIHCRGAVLLDEHGAPKRFVGTAQDISERKLSEIQIRQQLSRLTALRTIDQAITSSFDLRFTLDLFLSQVITQLQVDAASILILDATGQSLEYRATRGFRNPAIKSTEISLGKSLAGRAVMERHLIHIENLMDQQNFSATNAMQIGEGFVSYFAVPLIARAKVQGVLEVFHRTGFQPYPEWTDFLETLAGQAAIAIDNATLLDNLQKTNLELQQSYDATIEGWSHALDLRDRETEGHTRRVTDMALELARIMGIHEQKLVHMRRGGLLHDIGKLGVPDSILLKPGPLTEEEWEIMKMHPQFAYDWLAPIPYLRETVEIPYCHHERWDGTGYPRGLKGEAIPLTSRIFAVADVWDAVTSDRSYRRAWSQEQAIEYMRENSGLHFDPKVVEVFLKNIPALVLSH
ncbi:MAG: HD domain-containing phosphohydrolase [Byssovorax cruenta]